MKIKYSLDKLINDDELASLWEARLFLDDNHKEHKVIVKSLKQVKDIDNTGLNRFKELANTYLHVKCPSLVQLFDFGLYNKIFFITQEYVDGCSLEQILHSLSEKQVHLPLWFTSLMLIPVLQAVKIIHSGFNHQDAKVSMSLQRITPSKIMLGARGAVKLTECGILSQFIADDRDATKKKYRAPDSAKQDSHNINADIHSIGIILCECLTGCVPSMEYPLTAILSDNNWLPPEIASILKRALTLDINSRFAKIEDLSYALGNYLKSSGYRINNAEFMAMVSILNSINKSNQASLKQVDSCFAKIEQTAPQHIQWFKNFRNAFEKSGSAGSNSINDPLMHFSAIIPERTIDKPVSERSDSESTKAHNADKVLMKIHGTVTNGAPVISEKNAKSMKTTHKSRNINISDNSIIDQNSSGSSGDLWVSTRTLRLSGFRMRNAAISSDLTPDKSKQQDTTMSMTTRHSENSSYTQDNMIEAVNHKVEFELGIEALQKKDYHTALRHFEAAYLNAPENKIYSTNLKRIKSILNK